MDRTDHRDLTEKHVEHGVVRREIPRLDDAEIATLRPHDTAKLSDCMGHHGTMTHLIKPIAAGMRVVGSAVTVTTAPGDALYIAAAADVAGEGDVIVVDAGGYLEGAVIGERMAYYMHARRRIAGIVVDGAVRDVKGIRELGFPTFAAAVTPRIRGVVGPGAINVPVSCGGVVVHPGDVVVADDDGVVVVPREDVARITDLAERRLAAELDRVAQVDAGRTLHDVQGLASRLASWAGSPTPPA